jgi:hypothetical protein
MGDVPSTKENKTAAPKKGFPDPIERAIIAKEAGLEPFAKWIWDLGQGIQLAGSRNRVSSRVNGARQCFSQWGNPRDEKKGD